MTNEILKKLKDIKEKLSKSIRDKSVIKLSTYDNMLEDIKKSVELAEGNHSQKEVLDELKALYKGIYAIFTSISIDWDAHKDTLSAEQINVSHENLELILKIITLIKELDEKLSDKIISSDEIIAPNEIASFQDKMKKKLEEMQKQQPSQNTANQDNDGAQSVEPDDEEQYTELEKKAKIEFSQYIENGSIDSVSTEKTSSGNLHAEITLHDNQDNKDKNTSIKISELLNNEFCKSNKITSFSLLHSNKEEIISGCVDDKGVRCYDLSKIAPHGMLVKWYIGERECSITLSTNGNRVVVTGCKELPSLEDLKANNYVQIKIGAGYLSLADTVISTQLNQPAPQAAQQESSIAV